MKLRHALRALILLVSLVSTSQVYSRGGETGTLDKDPEAAAAATTVIDLNRQPTKSWAPYYLHHDFFRRLRARLSFQPIAPIPGWDSQHAWKYKDRYFTEDGDYEILPWISE